jgi:hypothetical protein
MLTGSLVADSILPKKVMDPIQLSLSLSEIAVRSQRLMGDFLTRRPELGGLGDPAGIGQAFLQLTAKMIADPMSIAQAQLELCEDHMKLWQRTTERLFDLTGRSEQRPAATEIRGSWGSMSQIHAKTDKLSLVAVAQPDGKVRVTSSSWDDRHAFNPELIVWISPEASLLKAKTHPRNARPAAFQIKAPFSSANEMSSFNCEFAFS